MEVAKPNATYELVIKTEMKRGSAVPKGRFNLPREVKAKTKDRVLVFAEGRQAEEARRAGADYVGGTELIEGVSFPSLFANAGVPECFSRWQTAVTQRLFSFVPHRLFALSRRNLEESWVPEV